MLLLYVTPHKLCNNLIINFSSITKRKISQSQAIYNSCLLNLAHDMHTRNSLHLSRIIVYFTLWLLEIHNYLILLQIITRSQLNLNNAIASNIMSLGTALASGVDIDGNNFNGMLFRLIVNCYIACVYVYMYMYVCI